MLDSSDPLDHLLVAPVRSSSLVSEQICQEEVVSVSGLSVVVVVVTIVDQKCTQVMRGPSKDTSDAITVSFVNCSTQARPRPVASAPACWASVSTNFPLHMYVSQSVMVCPHPILTKQNK